MFGSVAEGIFGIYAIDVVLQLIEVRGELQPDSKR
jgi:hypothetical protein